jgi:hypothetical protein
MLLLKEKTVNCIQVDAAHVTVQVDAIATHRACFYATPIFLFRIF